MCRNYFFACLLIFVLFFNSIAQVSLQTIKVKTSSKTKNAQQSENLIAKDSSDFPLSSGTKNTLADVKTSVIREITAYLNQFKGTCFGDHVSIGDPEKYKVAINRNIYRIIVGQEGIDLVNQRPDSQAYHDDTGFSGLLMANIVFPFDPDKLEAKKIYENRRTMAHELTHHMEYIKGVKIGGKPRSERNTDYQDKVVGTLKTLVQTESLLKDGRSNIAEELSRWGQVETDLRKLETEGFEGIPPDKTLEDLTGFNATFEKIEKNYLSGACGDKLKNLALLYRLLPRIKNAIDLDPLTINLGQEATSEAVVQNTNGEVLVIPTELKPKFKWKLPDGNVSNDNPIRYKPEKEGDYQISVEASITFEKEDFVIASGVLNLTVAPEEPSKTGKILIKAPKEVLVTDLIDAEAIIPPSLRSKTKGSYWYPGSCGATQNISSAKLQFTNPRLEKPQKTTITFNAQDENKNTFASAETEVLVKPAFFSGSASDVWKGGGHPQGFGIERQSAVRKRSENGKEINSATVSGRANIEWDLSSDFKTLGDIEKRLKKDQESRKDFTIASVSIAGFQGFALEQKQPVYGFRGSGYVDAGYPDAVMSGYGYAIKGCLVIRFSYSAGGSGIMLGEGTGFGKPEGAWWNDTAFIMSQTKAAASEAKAVLLGLTLAPNGNLALTPYKGPKLDGSDLPSLKLTVSPDNKKLKKGDVVDVQAVIENEENAEKPLQFTWTGEHTGSGQSVKFIADKVGKQTLSVFVDGIGTASVEFEVAPVKAEIVQVSPTAKKVTAGTPVSFSARLLSGDSEINGNYIYRWQPQPEAKFEPAEGAGKQTKAIFSKTGLTRVWVQILERKGEILQTVAESPHIEIEVIALIGDNNPNNAGGGTTSKLTLSTNKLNEAKTIIKKGQLDEAIVLVDEAVKLNPKNTEAATLSKKWKKERTVIKAQLAKVRTLIDQQRFLEASNEFIVAKNLHNLYPPVLEIEKELNDKWGKHDSGLNLAMGEVRMANQARKFKEALELAKEIRAKYRLHPETEKTLKSYEDWAKTSEAEKNRQRAILQQGEAKFNAYDYEGAIKDFDVMWGNNHNEYWGMYDPEPKKYGDLRNLAIVRLKRISELMPIIEQVVDNPRFNKTVLQSALKNVDEVLQLQPPNIKAQEYKTILTDRLGRGEKGVQYDQAIKKGNESYDAQNYGDAVKEYDKAVKADGKSADAYRRRAMAKRENSDLKGALKDFDKAIELDSSNNKAFLGRGIVREKLGDIDGALSDFSRGIELDPNYINSYYYRGHLRIKAKDYQGAISDYNKIIEIDPKDSVAHNNRGVAKEELGDLKSALKDYEKAVSLNPDYEVAKTNLAKLKVKMAGTTTGGNNTDLSSWSGEWNTNDNGYKLYLTQTGNRVSGTYPFDEGRIEGRIVGNKLIGTWSEAPTYKPNRDAGDIEFTMSADGKSFSGRWRYGSNEEWRTNPWNGTRANATTVNNQTQTNTIQTGKEVEILNTMNIYGVQNQPTSLTQFTITKPHVITYVMTYHWNNGRGNQKAGFIGFYNDRGERFGSWQAKGTPGQGGVPNANWEVFPNITIPPGTYTIVVSQEETWAQNSQSSGRGMAVVKGYLASGGITQTTTNNPTTTQKPPTKGTIVVAIFQNRSNEAAHIFAEGDNFGPQNKIAPGGSKEVSVKMTADGRIKFYAGRNGTVITSKIWTGDPSDTNRYPKVIFDGKQLIITTGLR